MVMPPQDHGDIQAPAAPRPLVITEVFFFVFFRGNRGGLLSFVLSSFSCRSNVAHAMSEKWWQLWEAQGGPAREKQR